MKKIIIINIIYIIAGFLLGLLNPYYVLTKEWWIFTIIVNAGCGFIIGWNRDKIYKILRLK